MDDGHAILEELRTQFASYSRPDDFIDRRHCCECEEHYAELLDVPVEAFEYAHVENQGWDATCFLTPDAFRYYFPALARVAQENPLDWMQALVMRLPLHYTDSFSPHDCALTVRLLEHWWTRSDLDEATRHAIAGALRALATRHP